MFVLTSTPISSFLLLIFQEKVQARDPPSTYLNKLKTYLDPKASKSSTKIKIVGDTSSTQVLRNLEISLRTNNIEWVREFLSEESQGLNVLIEYLNSRLQLLRHKLGAEKANMDAFGKFFSINPEKPFGTFRNAIFESFLTGPVFEV